MNIVKNGCGTSEDHFVEGYELARKHLPELRKRAWKNWWWFLVAPFIYFGISTNAFPQDSRASFIVGLIAFIFLEVAVILTFPWRRRRKLRKFYQIRVPEGCTCTVTINDEGYTCVDPGQMSNHYDWSGMRGFVEDANVLALIRNQRSYVPIYKRAYTADEIQEIKAEMAARNLKPL